MRAGRSRIPRMIAAALGTLLTIAALAMISAHGPAARLMIQRWGPGTPNSAVYSIHWNAAPWQDDASGPGLYAGKPVKLNATALGVRYLATMGTGGTWTRLWIPWAWPAAADVILLWVSLRRERPRQRLPR